MPVSRLDVLYRKFLLTKFFTRGWGPTDLLLRLFAFRQIVSNRSTCYKLVPKHYPVTIINEHTHSDCKIIDGKFRSPFTKLLGDLVPHEIEDAYFQMILPLQWSSSKHKPICIHLAGTGDHYFWRRRNIMAKPLLKDGIGAIILENPYYGLRKPHNQLRSSLHYVSDIFVMGGCLILECLVLLNWCEDLGFGPLGISGISMGGHMASLAASNWPKPLVLVPCLSWSTASSVFTEGVMSESIDWDMLQKQYLDSSIYCDILSKSCKIVDSPFACNLSKNTEIDFKSILKMENTNKINYVSPYDVLRLINKFATTKNCSTRNYKTNSSQDKLFIKNTNEFKSINTQIFGLIKRSTIIKNRDKEAVWFMRGMMDEFTHLKNFSKPFDTSLIVAVCANSDGYVPRLGVSCLEDIWPGSTVRYVETGHVGAYIWYRKLFRNCIVETFQKAAKY